MSKKTSSRTPNDQRSDAKNPNSPDYKGSSDNRSRQLDPEHSTYHSSRDKKQ